jgi:hypothetical protein
MTVRLSATIRSQRGPVDSRFPQLAPCPVLMCCKVRVQLLNVSAVPSWHLAAILRASKRRVVDQQVIADRCE